MRYKQIFELLMNLQNAAPNTTIESLALVRFSGTVEEQHLKAIVMILCWISEVIAVGVKGTYKEYLIFRIL